MTPSTARENLFVLGCLLVAGALLGLGCKLALDALGPMMAGWIA